MRRIREVLRLRHELSRTHRQISAATGLSKGSISTYLRRAREAGLDWERARELSDGELEARLFRHPGRNLPVDRLPIDLEWVHREMRRKGVTLQLLWVEYREGSVHDPRGRRPYQYSQFCDRYRKFRGRVDASMRQEHRAGEKAFLDYSGMKPTIADRETGEVIEVELFVAVLGASSFTYAEATHADPRRLQRLDRPRLRVRPPSASIARAELARTSNVSAMPDVGELSELLELLLDTGVQFVLVGGGAAVIHGAPITTQDVDIVHSREPENLCRLLKALEGLDARVVDLAGRDLRPTATALEGGAC